MQLDVMYHRMKQNWSYAYDEKTLHIRLRTKRDDVDTVVLHCGDKYGWDHTNSSVPMAIFASDELFDYWEAAIQPRYRRTVYYFEIRNQEQVVYMLEKGFFDEAPDVIYEGLFDFPFLNPIDIISPPAWVKDAVFYQIFPERFANGDKSNDPEGVLPWGGTPTPTNYFGGDLQGVLDHLDYLSKLGVNAIYFNPLFQATTNHKYDTQDYFKVDAHFGTNEKLKELVEACHQRGIRVVLDAVFNHCGNTFPAFVDVVKNGPKSKYADWFFIREWPLDVKDGIPTYDTFGFEPIMPKLNTENPEVRDYLLSIARYWIEEIGIDGWRLDVANEVDHHFWREFRKAVKEINPEAYILGEIMHDSMAWLQGDQFDAVMNYPFTNALLNFFAYSRIDANGFADAIQRQIASYPRQVNETSFNLLGSHDTTRLLTLCQGNKDRLKLAYLFELTFVGAPCIYYGDEIGMDGDHDPHNRKCMEWDVNKQDQNLLTFFQNIIHLRLKQEALRTGSIRFLAQSNKQLLTYERENADERFLIAINNSDAVAAYSLSESNEYEWIDALSGESIKSGTKQLSLPAFGYSILKAKVKVKAGV
ncbi:alpha-glycosidase [Paenibacillus alkaliterrae]|uniref:alpha-glycosidase n=1 Tax=Paenibacillus alkaliterrae TaxID=320909 RepID=UPI001F2653B6|nr:alpha-glycosidase [Paenibacillus alkaliterrae]MCF2941223.1 alpha-glycosidase [Paenibacillus alkaliterrae]